MAVEQIMCVLNELREWFRRGREFKRETAQVEKDVSAYVSAYDRKQSEVRAARMGGNSPQAWRGK